MRKLIVSLLAVRVLSTAPSYAGVNKTGDAFGQDISFVMSKAEKGTETYAALNALKADFQKKVDNSWKIARHQFYEYASSSYDKMNKIASKAGLPKVVKPDWL